MLLGNILKCALFKRILIKFTYIFITIIFLLGMFLSIMSTKVEAAQYTQKYTSGSLDKYSGYSILIDALKEKYPNWTFTILYTGLDWNQVIKNETTVVHGRNLITGSKTGEWVCSRCADNKYDNGSWKCASEATVAYYMDPRNSLFEDYIFQFENLKWVDGIYTIDGINSIIADCKYMQGSKITYTATDGTTKTINKSYAQLIYDAAKKNNISAYHLAARIRQEQGPGEKASATATGTYTGYKGYYNFFNVNAFGSGSSTIIKNALECAKSKGWTDPEKSIEGGAIFVADEYINDGQSTLYLQKFDVDSSDGSLYWHQYMQNVSAAKTEGSTILKTYKKIDQKLENTYNFVIPVYNNMPDARCPQPGSQLVVTQNIEVTNTTIDVRKSRSIDAEKIATLKKGDKVLRIEVGNIKYNGYLWDKVVLSNGTKGYIIASGIKLLEDISNCNIRAVAIEPGNVRNGPGTSGTTVLTTLAVGQNVTIIEKGVYKNINGENWTRIYLSDGRQGYIVARYLEEIKSNTSSSESGKEIVKVICNGGLAVRKEPGTSSEILKYAAKGDYLTRIDKEFANKDGYIWDKITTDDGIEGYVATGDKDEEYIQLVNNIQVETTIKGDGVKTSGTNVVCEPKMTIESIQKIAKDAVIKDSNGNELTTGDIGTGYTVKYNGQTYTVVKLGDVDCDAKVTSADYVKIKSFIMGKESLSNIAKSGVDVDGDGRTTSADYVKLKSYIMQKTNITI